MEAPPSASLRQEPMENTWLWLAAGAAIGWMTTQLGTLLKDVLRRYLLKRAVVSELRQVHEESRRVWTSLARSLQIHALGGVDNALPLPLSNRVYAGHYGEALLVFTRVRRNSKPRASSASGSGCRR